MNAIAIGTFQKVPGNKALPTEMAKHVKSVLLDIISRDFTRTDGSTVAERTIGKALGLSQPQLNAIRRWDEKSGKAANIGVGALLALSEYTHQSIDAVLGRELGLAVQQRQEQLDAIVSKAEEITALLAKEKAFGPGSKIGKLRLQIQKLAMAARQQRVMDEREKRVNAMPGGRRVG